MIARSAIKITKSDGYNKINLEEYQWLIGKLIYLVYKTKINIAFIIRQLSKHNDNPKKGYL